MCVCVYMRADVQRCVSFSRLLTCVYVSTQEQECLCCVFGCGFCCPFSEGMDADSAALGREIGGRGGGWMVAER